MVKKRPNVESPENQLASFLDRYSADVRTTARLARAKMRALVPGAFEMVYDNYNALVIGFSPTKRPSDALFSIALYPRYVTLFFLRGAKLADPGKLLQGAGNQVRRIKLNGAADLDQPAVRELMARAIDTSPHPFDRANPGKLVIKSISPKQRPRRPA